MACSSRILTPHISLMICMLVAACLVNAAMASRKSREMMLKARRMAWEFTNEPEHETNTLILCQGEPTIEISCDIAEEITIVSASYGRTEPHVCPGWGTWNVECTDDTHTDRLSEICNGEQSCEVSATDEFWGGNPCPGTSTYKYLEVEYQCAYPRGSCRGLCGAGDFLTCWCDEVCLEYGDCCDDYEDACMGFGPPTMAPTAIPPVATHAPTPFPTPYVATSCNGYCGGENVEQSCWCDPEYCALIGDCCDDIDDLCEAPVPVPAVQGPVVVTRREIRTLPMSEQRRFTAAVKRMQINRGDDTSLYSDLASYHRNYCIHGVETFHSWHRMYVVTFERALQEADRANGNDGVIAVPYWNWLDEELQAEQVIPNVAVEWFSDNPDFFGIPIERVPLEQIRALLESFPLRKQVFGSLENAEHWQFASVENRGFDPPSAELPHNRAHIAIGWPMSGFDSAFDVMFFLHHCFCDLIYESYIQMNPDSQAQMESHGALAESQGGVNRYHQPLIPFVYPDTNITVTSAGIFNTSALGFVYDHLLEQQASTLQTLAAPQEVDRIAAMFKDIDLSKIQRTYQLHVFVMDESRADTFRAPTEVAEFLSQPEYGGMAVVFGRYMDDRPPYNDYVSISDALLRQNLTRADAILVTWCLDTTEPNFELVPIEDTSVPMPVIIGAGFNNMYDSIGVNGEGDEFEIKNIQDYLIRYGYLANPSLVEYGVLDAHTEEALKRFQKQYGIEGDGICGPLTKAAMLHPRDYDREVTDSNQRHPALREGSSNPNVSYYLGISPLLLSRDDVEAEVRASFDFWEPHVALRFEQVDDKSDADITVEWTTEWINEFGTVFPFDGRGLTLARGSPSTGIVLDADEVWKLLINEVTDPTNIINEFYLQPVLIHEIGHVIGLEHVDRLESVMSPFYNPFVTELSDNDLEELRAVVGTEEELVALRPAFFRE